MEPVVLVPVKAFADAKARLAGVLSPSHRESLARFTAERVLAAAAPARVYVVCDSDTVAQWAADHGASVLWHPGVGLNNAIMHGVADLAGAGLEHVVIAHGDLPRAIGLASLAAPGCITLVPDRAGEGTNVLTLPLPTDFRFSYGAGSFHRHLAMAMERALHTGHRVRVLRHPLLGLDIDTPHDLAHPLVQEVLPSWLRTNPASPSPARG